MQRFAPDASTEFSECRQTLLNSGETVGLLIPLALATGLTPNHDRTTRDCRKITFVFSYSRSFAFIRGPIASCPIGIDRHRLYHCFCTARPDTRTKHRTSVSNAHGRPCIDQAPDFHNCKCYFVTSPKPNAPTGVQSKIIINLNKQAIGLTSGLLE